LRAPDTPGAHCHKLVTKSDFSLSFAAPLPLPPEEAKIGREEGSRVPGSQTPPE
jgi:hypothetical protein